ncbi:MAG: hypothetical protein RBS31_08135 [Candidatus Syntrophosphaera sp.]|jgi:hypothetical protein|nr:hypothetical protein [Candidatus Cloacimonadota bacterium]MDX9950417.1 hypothetical protein [Candidatus Syntrophosphaera sp.]
MLKAFLRFSVGTPNSEVVGTGFIWRKEQSRHPLPPDKSRGSDRLETGVPQAPSSHIVTLSLLNFLSLFHHPNPVHPQSIKKSRTGFYRWRSE